MKELPWPAGICIYIGYISTKYIAGSLLFIWSANTLFGCNIPFTFKSCLAGVTLIWVARLFLRGLNIPWEGENDAVEEGRLFEEEQREFFEQLITSPFTRKVRRKIRRR
jgi:hypothetical protein